MLFTIGQIAKMYDISHDTLRYYDKIGLLTPNVRKENGYRYYTTSEIEILEVILLSRELGISLQDIKTKIESENIDGYIELYEKQEKLLNEKIRYYLELKQKTIRSKELSLKMKNFKNGDIYNDLTFQRINKRFIFLYTDGHSSVGEIVKNRNIIMLVENKGKKISIDINRIGSEVFDDDIVNIDNYIEKKYEGEYLTLVRKDTFENILTVIEDIVNSKKLKDIIDKDKEIILEEEFVITKKQCENLYLMNIYIPKKS